jgi:hypothetical protein
VWGSAGDESDGATFGDDGRLLLVEANGDRAAEDLVCIGLLGPLDDRAGSGRCGVVEHGGIVSRPASDGNPRVLGI